MTAMMKPLCVDLRVATNSVDLGGIPSQVKSFWFQTAA